MNSFPQGEPGKKRTALLLGGNGFIGSHLADTLLARGWHVRILDRSMEVYRAPLLDVAYFAGSFSDERRLDEALAGVDTVFHLVSTTLPKTSNDDPAFDVDSNVIGSIKVLHACVKHSIRKIVFLSSGGIVYGRPVSLPVPETHPTEPDCSYGIGKLSIEKYLALFHKLHGLEYAILRPSNPYGPRQNPLGAQGVIAVFLGRILSNRPIEIWGNGETVRDYLHVSDLVEGIYEAATRSTPSRIFNLGMGLGHSLNDLCRVISETLGRPIDIRYAPSRLFDVPAIVLDISRAKQELGWTPKVRLQAGIKDTLEFVNRHVDSNALKQ
jgi:UDP-glucose 4-epimerase